MSTELTHNNKLYILDVLDDVTVELTKHDDVDKKVFGRLTHAMTLIERNLYGSDPKQLELDFNKDDDDYDEETDCR